MAAPVNPIVDTISSVADVVLLLLIVVFCIKVFERIFPHDGE